jgi:hypothetical protein
MAWTKPKEITERRKAEQALFAKGSYPTGLVPVYAATAAGAVIWRPVKRMTRAEVVALLDGSPAAPKTVAASPAPDPVAKPSIWAALARLFAAIFKR